MVQEGCSIKACITFSEFTEKRRAEYRINFDGNLSTQPNAEAVMFIYS